MERGRRKPDRRGIDVAESSDGRSYSLWQSQDEDEETPAATVKGFATSVGPTPRKVMTEKMLDAIEWTCAVNRALNASGHEFYHGQTASALDESERDWAYEAQRLGVDPVTFANRVVAARDAKDAVALEGVAVAQSDGGR